MVCCVWCVCMTYGLRVRRVVSVRVACVRMVGRRVTVCVGVCGVVSVCGGCIVACVCWCVHAMRMVGTV